MTLKVKKALIPVAGLGTRMLPATKAIPKELLPVYDRPIIEHVVKEAISGGISEIILVTRSGKEAIENHFDVKYELEHRLESSGKVTILGSLKQIIPTGINITSIRQTNPLGLGHAVLCAKHLIKDEPFAVLLPDVFVLDNEKNEKNQSFRALIEAWRKTGIGQVLVEKVSMNEIEKYGVVDIGGIKSKVFVSTPLNRLVEKPRREDAPSNLAIVGRYILPSNIFEFLEKITEDTSGEIQLTDALDRLIIAEGLNALETSAQIFDCGTKEGFLGANFAVGMTNQKTNSYLTKLFKNYDL